MRATVNEMAARTDTVRVNFDLGRNEPARLRIPAVRIGCSAAEGLEKPGRGQKTERPDPPTGVWPHVAGPRHLSMIPLLETPSGFP